MAELPAYHGRTHAVGGSDPIPFPTTSSGSILTASFNSPLRSRSMTGGQYTVMDFTSMWSNDASFGYIGATGSPLRAKYIEISTEGLYMVQGMTMNDDTTPFTSNDDPYIEILYWDPISSTFTELINAKDAGGFDDGQSPIYGEMFTADEYAHQQMVQTIWFNFTAAWFGNSTIGLGVGLAPQNNVTKTVGGGLVVSRIGEVLTETTVV